MGHQIPDFFFVVAVILLTVVPSPCLQKAKDEQARLAHQIELAQARKRDMRRQAAKHEQLALQQQVGDGQDRRCGVIAINCLRLFMLSWQAHAASFSDTEVPFGAINHSPSSLYCDK